MKVLAAGGLRTDYLITRKDQAYVELAGGNALYAAVGAALWLEHVCVWARYGDNFPRYRLQEIAALGLDTRSLVRVNGEQDHRTFFAYTAAGMREDTNPDAHFARIGQPLPPALRGYVHSTPQQDDPHALEPLALRPQDWSAGLADATAVHLAPMPLATHRQLVPLLRRNGTTLVTADPGERYMIPERRLFIRELLPQLDAFLPSDQEVRSLFGRDVDLWQAAQQLNTWGAPLVLIKAGAQGVLIRRAEDNRRWHLPPYHGPDDSRVVDVTGAGDAFCGGFLAGWALTGDPLRAARHGLVSASIVIEGYGALYALRHRRDEAVHRLGELAGRQT